MLDFEENDSCGVIVEQSNYGFYVYVSYFTFYWNNWYGFMI